MAEYLVDEGCYHFHMTDEACTLYREHVIDVTSPKDRDELNEMMQTRDADGWVKAYNFALLFAYGVPVTPRS